MTDETKATLAGLIAVAFLVICMLVGYQASALYSRIDRLEQKIEIMEIRHKAAIESHDTQINDLEMENWRRR